MSNIILLEDIREKKKVVNLEDIRVENAILYNQMLHTFLEIRDAVQKDFFIEGMIDMTYDLEQDVNAWHKSLCHWRDEIDKQQK